ncbi:hypothetical protein DL240_17485 [Lujinxingia litoralis]|uniref:Lipoprotein n=1 Tax=Lujinxingia litoralis TaxID=2211119 RepID=A0A328C765_9DELT|nr:hypothetical protein DL240_17485 [Lujinxingia litoralis]
MKHALMGLVVMGALSLSACMTIVLEEDTGRRSQRLESPKVCKDRCQARFHECRESRTGRVGRGRGRGRGKGKGASVCAHEKNRCKARC